jgi:hypothetical protein
MFADFMAGYISGITICVLYYYTIRWVLKPRKKEEER